jgi:hypothetical protein
VTEPKHPNIPKSQHLVPRLHLQHFAGPDPKGHVWTYDKEQGNTRHAVPGETATFSHFYSRQYDDGTYDVSAETQLADNEGRAAPVYKELIRGNFPKNIEERSIFSLFWPTSVFAHAHSVKMQPSSGGLRYNLGCTPSRKTTARLIN